MAASDGGAGRTMHGRDMHTALKSAVLRKTQQSNMQAVLAQLQWGKDDKAYSLHVAPNSFSTSGLQTTDYLAYLGFSPSNRCAFTTSQRCYCRWATEDFDPEAFARAFDESFARMQVAQQSLDACGFVLPQPEGWGYFFGGSGTPVRARSNFSGDGHTGIKIDSMKASEDPRFEFRFTFIDTGHGKGFVTHYRPKHLPVSSEVNGVLHFLGLKQFADCPEFDFEECYFGTRAFEQEGRAWNPSVDYAHRAFDAHATQFSTAIESMLAANAAIEAVGMTLLPLARPNDRMRADIATNFRESEKSAVAFATQKPAVHAKPIPERFDVAISFAGSERPLALALAKAVRAAGFSVFYDDFFPEQLWGKNLVIFFDEIFRKKARYCVIFVSQEYLKGKWTVHEARSAQARALEEKGNEYILPVQVDGTELEGLLPTIGYVPIKTGIERIGEMLVGKLTGR
jgi:hypothetical protein